MNYKLRNFNNRKTSSIEMQFVYKYSLEYIEKAKSTVERLRRSRAVKRIIHIK